MIRTSEHGVGLGKRYRIFRTTGPPSDHASSAFAIASVLVLFHRRLGVLALLVAAFMCYARVYVGDHYPGDVAAGALIGIVVAVLLVIWLDNAMVLLRRLADRLIRLLRLPLPT